MIIFTDIVSGDEMISDSYDLKEVDGVFYEADCAMIEEGGVDVDIGANASAEEAGEALEDGKVKVNNIVASFRLQSTSFSRDAFFKYLQLYLKLVKKHLQENGMTKEEVTAWQNKVNGFYKNNVLKNEKVFSDWEFYVGAKMDVDGMVALLNYREDGITPYFTFLKHGLKEQKV